MVLDVPGADAEGGGGLRVVSKLVHGEADGVGADTLSDVLVHAIQLSHSGDTVVLHQVSHSSCVVVSSSSTSAFPAIALGFTILLLLLRSQLYLWGSPFFFFYIPSHISVVHHFW